MRTRDGWRRSAWTTVLYIAAAGGASGAAGGAGGAGAQATPPTASFLAAQSEHGRALYAQHCASCHGAQLTGGSASPLAGQSFQSRWAQPSRSLDDLFYVMRTSMPFGAGGTLSNDEYLALLAFMLEQNGQPAGARALVSDRVTLGAARIVATAAAAPRTTPARIADFVTGSRGLSPVATGPTNDDLLRAPGGGRDWLTHTRDYAGSRYSPLAQITASNVSRLHVACVFQVGVNAAFQTGPVVHDGTMYLTASFSTIAIDAATCRPRWRHDWAPTVPGTGGLANRGVAVKDGRVVRATADGFLLALDAASGTLLWARRVSDATTGEMISMPPLVYDDLIFVGPAVSEFGIRGWIGAFRLSDGERVWRFNIVPKPGEPGAETWKQNSDIPIGGGAVWTPLSLDPISEILYVPAANPAPDFPVALRGGTNLYTNSIIALHLRSGKLAWYDQIVPLDDHDWDLTQVSPLYRATVRGKARNLVATAGKDGVLRVIDRESHERMFEATLTTITNTKAPVTTAGTHACPGVFGGVQWNGPTYHPGANMLVTPAVDWCARFILADTVKFVPFQNYLGGSVVLDTVQGGWITGVDASTGAVKWRYRSTRPVVAAVTATAGGVVFAGELTGDLVALDVVTGAVRFRHYTGGQVGGGIVTYQAGGRQFVAVASGTTSPYWAERFSGSPTITVFALDGVR
ncbi:MAG: PQQ-binding-like beta-propeller repeat protein [Gemmatimonadaceae bacterium]|nr:PQQ-binding-like beta-propeller repeat protein [Gemmatimonadaceae bacterium]